MPHFEKKFGGGKSTKGPAFEKEKKKKNSLHLRSAAFLLYVKS